VITQLRPPRPVRPAPLPEPTSLVATALAQAGLAVGVRAAGSLVRVSTADGRVAYLEPRAADWVVHLDGAGRAPDAQHVCPSLGAALARLTAALTSSAPSAILPACR
jgi:hypothetical protein